jgi:hypothetical protein
MWEVFSGRPELLVSLSPLRQKQFIICCRQIAESNIQCTDMSFLSLGEDGDSLYQRV